MNLKALFTINEIWLLEKSSLDNDVIFENWFEFILIKLFDCKSK